MARGGSHIEVGTIYHLISRFVAKEWFFESAVERRMYLSLLGVAIAATDWRLFSYALMSSHIHLGVVSGTTPLRDWLQPMHTIFANWLNQRRERIGAVFVRGPNVITFPQEGAAALIRYIHCNPVRAAIVNQPGASDWTSHRAYEGVAFAQSWLDIGCGVSLAGFSTAADLAKWCCSGDSNGAYNDLLAAHRKGRGRPRLPSPGTIADRGYSWLSSSAGSTTTGSAPMGARSPWSARTD